MSYFLCQNTRQRTNGASSIIQGDRRVRLRDDIEPPARTLRPDAPTHRRATRTTHRHRTTRHEQAAHALLARLSVAEKLGQLIVPVIFPAGPDDLALTPELRALIAEDHIGGYFLCAAGADATRLRAFTAALQTQARVPLLLATDFEGGAWNFIQSAVGPRPAPDTIQTARDAYIKGTTDAALLTTVGVHVNFAPTVDLLTNPDTPILRQRTFGSDSATVAGLAAAYLDGLAAGGVAGCLKHFPGLGAATRDPHIELPTVTRDVAAIRAVELAPYRTLLASGHAPMVMTTHMDIPALDAELPTSLSPTIIHGLLRKELAYDGVVISDSLAMGAITTRYSVAEASALALRAGTDLLLGAPDFASARATRERLHEALAGGEIFIEQVDLAVLRILRFKARWGLL